MENITAIIVEDSRLARNELKELLKKHPQIELIAEAENVDTAFELINQKQPRVLFLDINMPRLNGFEFLKVFHEKGWHQKEQSPLFAILSSSTSFADRERVAEFPTVKFFFTKPFKKEYFAQIEEYFREETDG